MEVSTIRVEEKGKRVERKKWTYWSTQACETGDPWFLFIQKSIYFLQCVWKSLKSLEEKRCVHFTSVVMKSSFAKKNSISQQTFNYFFSGCLMFKILTQQHFLTNSSGQRITSTMPIRDTQLIAPCLLTCVDTGTQTQLKPGLCYLGCTNAANGCKELQAGNQTAQLQVLSRYSL